MTTTPTPADRPADQLRAAVARALVRYDWNAGLSGRDTPSEHHYGEADAVLAVLPAHALAVARQILGTTSETTATAPLARVWTVWVEDESTLGHCADEVTAKLAAIEHHQESETPGLEFVYGWNERGGHLELLADGTDTGIRVKYSKVHGAPPAPADRAAVLNEVAGQYEQMLADIGADTAQDPRYWTGVQHVTLGLRRLAGEAAAGAHHPSPRIRCAHTDVLYGQCVRYLDDHDGDCQHEHQPTPATPAAPEEIQ